jgi:hypothetical protein
MTAIWQQFPKWSPRSAKAKAFPLTIAKLMSHMFKSNVDIATGVSVCEEDLGSNSTRVASRGRMSRDEESSGISSMMPITKSMSYLAKSDVDFVTGRGASAGAFPFGDRVERGM